MISLIVDKPIKLSGRFSVKVFLAYSRDFVNYIKGLEGPCIWLKNISAWECPLYHLSELLDTCIMLDDVDLEIREPETPEITEITKPLTEQEISNFKVKPFIHQIEAINFLLKQQKSLLLDAPGLGKTNEMLWYAETLKTRGAIDHCLIITGIAAIRQNWKKEIKQFSKESVIVLGERINRNNKIVYTTVKERAEQLKAKIPEFFVIMNVESLRDERIIESFIKSENKFGLICFDEIHRGVATKSSLSAAGLLKLDSEYKVGASGSLIVNSPISAYVSLCWTKNDVSTLTNFKSEYCEYSRNFGHNLITGYKHLEYLKDELDNCSIRRTFDQVKDDMPKKTIDLELVELDEINSKFYEAIKTGVKEEADKIELTTNNLLALTTRLRQATSDPTILTSEQIQSNKISRCIDLVEDIISQGEKVIVMDVFKSSIYTLQKLLAKYNPVIGTGDLQDSEVDKNIEKFRKDPNCKLLLGTSQKIGTGFSIPECKYLIFISTAWTYSEFNQNCERIYRITSNKPVYIKVLAAKDTIDEHVWDIVNHKKDLSDYIIDGKMNNEFANELRSIIKKL